MRRHIKASLAATAIAVAGLLLLSAAASASKQAVARIPSDAGDIAVNSTGAGPGNQGDIYVAGTNRIERFGQDDNGTPANPYDDSYPFISAWGVGVQSGGSGYEVCTELAECKDGLASSGNGGLASAEGIDVGIDVDRDTGDVYVSDSGNHRVAVYTGDGTFLRAFGFDVVQSGPGDNGAGYEVCVAAGGDVCKSAVAGAGIGQIANGLGITISQADGSASSGTVFLADQGNHRVDTYNLDGSAPSSIGSAADFGSAAPLHIAVDSRGILYVENSESSTPSQVVERYDSQNANGGGVGFLAPISIPPLLSRGGSQVPSGLDVDPDSDGPGPDTDVLYALRNMGPDPETVVQQFGPLNAPGLTSPPAAADDVHGLVVGFAFINGGGIGLDDSRNRLFVNTGGEDPEYGTGAGTYVLDNAGGIATANLDSIDGITATTATVHATVNPNGPPAVSYFLEYSTDGSNWSSQPGVLLGSQETPQAVEALLDPPGAGLEPSTLYHVRLAVPRPFNPPVVTSELTFTTSPTAPQVETVGTPLRTITTAQLGGRVNPRNTATSFHFEYGAQGPCDLNPCASTPSHAAGSGNLTQLVGAEITGLEPGVTYHYRVVADNGNPGSPVVGKGMTVTTRVSEAPLSHGHFPGPTGSDRAWEQVSTPDTGGNPVAGGYGFSADGQRAIYQISGGTPLSDTGGVFNMYFAQRPAGEHPTSGWQTQAIFPSRDRLVGANWFGPAASDDLSSIFVRNFGTGATTTAFFRLNPGASAATLHESPVNNFGTFAASANGTRVVAVLRGSPDPEHPLAPSVDQLYDLTSGAPHLISFLPNGVVPSCLVSIPGASGFTGDSGASRYGSHVVSADGSLAFFSCGGIVYAREIAAAHTVQVSQEGCASRFLKATPGSVFYWCSASGGNIFRFDLNDETRDCVTCVLPGLDAQVQMGGNPTSGPDDVAVAEDGSRVYFRSSGTLAPGAAPMGIYRIDVATGDLAFIGNIGDSAVGELAGIGEGMTPDGSVIIFRSNAAALNPLGDGSDNGGTYQYYRYDDNERSLVCVSCPQDDSEPKTDLSREILGLISVAQTAPGATPLADDGTFAFATTTPLVGSDQNTPGPGQNPEVGADLYEWRDGRLLLVTDGLTSWPAGSPPRLSGVSPSGSDIFFSVSAQYTPDALDSYYRLYDARIGGGIDFPDAPHPCPLEVCQGTPKGAPEEAAPGTATLAGAGNRATPPTARQCPKGKRKARARGKVRCVSRKSQKPHHRRANHNRRAAR